MNNNFFDKKYGKVITNNPNKEYIQPDGYVYATFINMKKPLLVIDDVSMTETCGSDWYPSYTDQSRVKCINFLDTGIMTLYDYFISGRHQEINYFCNWCGPFKDGNFNLDRFDLTIKQISDEDAIKSLRKVFYFLQPQLQSSTLAGGGKANTESDPNYYSGSYYLQDGEEYTILKCGKILEFYKGHKRYTYMFGDDKERNDCLHREYIDFELYEKSIELNQLKRTCSYLIDEMINYDIQGLKEKLDRIDELTKYLKEVLY